MALTSGDLYARRESSDRPISGAKRERACADSATRRLAESLDAEQKEEEEPQRKERGIALLSRRSSFADR
jgi:hypothetical protein